MEAMILLLWALFFIVSGLYSLILLSMPFFIIGIYFRLNEMLLEYKRNTKKAIPPEVKYK